MSNGPGVYVEESGPGRRPVVPVATDVAAFVGPAAQGPVDEPVRIAGIGEFERVFGPAAAGSPLGAAVHDFFRHGGRQAVVVRSRTALDAGDAVDGALDALVESDAWNLLVLASDDAGRDVPAVAYEAALDRCVAQRAVLLVDPPLAWATVADVVAGRDAPGFADRRAANAVLYFPQVRRLDPATGVVRSYPPSGTMAGVIARTDLERGCWHAPAGLGAALDVTGLAVPVDDAATGDLAAVAVNALRELPGGGRVAWGARTLGGTRGSTDPYRYLPVRRTALMIESSLERGLQWTVFEPNDEPLWSAVRASAEAFLFSLFRQGAFQGTTSRDAFFVQCGRTTMTAADIAAGRVVLVVGFAALKPAEFVIVTLGLSAVAP